MAHNGPRFQLAVAILKWSVPMIFSLVQQVECLNCKPCACSYETLDCSNLDLDLIPQISALTRMYATDHSFNRVAHFPTKALKGSLFITHLNLSNNRLKIIKPYYFDAVYGLEVLDLSRNMLRTIEENSLSYLSSLQYLDLSNNFITDIPEKELSEMDNLRYLHIGENPIKMDSIQNLTLPSFVTEISLNGIGMTSLPELLLEKSSNLQILDLSNNNLTFLSFPVLQGLSTLSRVYLDGNTWTCDCRIRVLVSWLRFRSNKTAGEMDQYICHAPRHMAGQSLANVSYSDLTCWRPVFRCPPWRFPTRKPYVYSFTYKTGLNVAAPLVAVGLMFLLCVIYDKGKKTILAKRRQYLLRVMSSQAQLCNADGEQIQVPISDSNHTQLPNSDSIHTVSFMLGDKEDCDQE